MDQGFLSSLLPCGSECQNPSFIHHCLSEPGKNHFQPRMSPKAVSLPLDPQLQCYWEGMKCWEVEATGALEALQGAPEKINRMQVSSPFFPATIKSAVVCATYSKALFCLTVGAKAIELADLRPLKPSSL